MKRYIVEPGSTVKLDDFDPADRGGFKGGKKDAGDALKKIGTRLADLQELLWAEHKHRLLVVLQGMDTAGKDGTIRHVFRSLNPQGVRVANFKVPTEQERAHDFLWRIHRQAPGDGEIVIFNRSHYEDVLVVRVHNLVPADVWKKRYDQINDFEKMLADSGTTILKFFLQISFDEQRERLQARLDRPDKRWKFNTGDLAERKLWDDYVNAYEVMLSRTSTEWAPWHVVPSNRKWYRNLTVARVMVEAMEKLKMSFPEPEENLDGIVID